MINIDLHEISHVCVSEISQVTAILDPFETKLNGHLRNSNTRTSKDRHSKTSSLQVPSVRVVIPSTLYPA
jgi:hypothetical protein